MTAVILTNLQLWLARSASIFCRKKGFSHDAGAAAQQLPGAAGQDLRASFYAYTGLTAPL